MEGPAKDQPIPPTTPDRCPSPAGSHSGRWPVITCRPGSPRWKSGQGPACEPVRAPASRHPECGRSSWTLTVTTPRTQRPGERRQVPHLTVPALLGSSRRRVRVRPPDFPSPNGSACACSKPERHRGGPGKWSRRRDRTYRAAGIARKAPVADCLGQAPQFVREKENFNYPERAVALRPEPVREERGKGRGDCRAAEVGVDRVRAAVRCCPLGQGLPRQFLPVAGRQRGHDQGTVAVVADISQVAWIMRVFRAGQDH
jgi:hypothetical protein